MKHHLSTYHLLADGGKKATYILSPSTHIADWLVLDESFSWFEYKANEDIAYPAEGALLCTTVAAVGERLQTAEMRTASLNGTA